MEVRMQRAQPRPHRLFLRRKAGICVPPGVPFQYVLQTLQPLVSASRIGNIIDGGKITVTIEGTWKETEEKLGQLKAAEHKLAALHHIEKELRKIYSGD